MKILFAVLSIHTLGQFFKDLSYEIKILDETFRQPNIDTEDVVCFK